MSISAPTDAKPKKTDSNALLLMLAYVEAECRRLGALDAARYAALAVSFVPVEKLAQLQGEAVHGAAPARPRRQRRVRLH